MDVKRWHSLRISYSLAAWLVGLTGGWMDVWGDIAADRWLYVRMEGWTKKWTDRWRGRQAARHEQPLIVVLLTMWLVNTLLRLKHYLPLSGCPKPSTKTKEAPQLIYSIQARSNSLHSQYMHIAFHMSSTSPPIFASFLCVLPKEKNRFIPIQSNPSSCSKQQLQHFGRASTHRGAQLHLHSPFPCIGLFCECVYVCVCAFTPVSPLKGLWFQRRPLYFLHCLATITKASTPLLRRLSTWIACCLFLLFKIVL